MFIENCEETLIMKQKIVSTKTFILKHKGI